VTLKIETDWAKATDSGSRHNTIVDTLVLHTTEGGTIEGATDWWDNEDVIASAHYVIDGKRIVQVVAEGDCAFHAGNRAMNRRSIGIEVVGKCDRRGTWTPEIMAQLVALSAEIVERHQIPIVRQPGPGICGHIDVPNPRDPSRRGGLSGHVDPGPYFPWQPYLDALRAELHPVATEEVA
jgi:N-acetyl-anhydromuramyl-L-alanine amidase AmpD